MVPPPYFAPDEMRRQRKRVGLSQEIMADRMGYATPWQYKRWEKGAAPISLAHAERFVQIIQEEQERIALRERTFTQSRDKLRGHLPRAS